MRHTFTPNRSCLAALLAVAASAPALAGPAYSTPQVFERPGWATTQLWDINSTGQIVGQSRSDTAAEGFLYAGGVFITVVPPGAASSTITGISDGGALVGAYFTDVSSVSVSTSFIYENGAYSNFTLPGASDVTVRHISANGRYLTGTYSGPAISNRGFAFDRQTSTARDILAPTGVVIAQGITSQGMAVGSVAGPTSYAFTFDMTSGVMTPYAGGDLGARPRFRDINDNGVITGFSGTQAFVGTPGNWTFFDPAPGFGSAGGYGLNNLGDLVGYYSGAAGETQAFVSSPVPEPAAWALLAGGLALLAWRRRPT